MRHWLFAFALAPLLFATSPAQAGDEFERGFRDELGRIAAHEAVYVGRGVLARILLGPPAYPPPGYYAPARGYYAYPAPPPPVYYAPPPVRYHHHHHHHHHHHYYDDCDY